MPKRAKSRASVFTTATVVSFSFTLLAAGIAVLTGLLPLHHVTTLQRVDVGSLLFIMPVEALVLGVCVEATRFALRHSELPAPRQRQTVRWTPGRREG
jgi:hypothetical protein